MRTIFSKLFFLPCLFSLISCKDESLSSGKKEITEHDYEEIIDREIGWNDLFSIGIPQYFVYFYSPTCSHCKEIKDAIIEYALEDERMHFVKFSDEVTVAPYIDNTIGATCIDDVAILGTPSLIEIINGAVSNNMAGAKAILNFLNLKLPD